MNLQEIKDKINIVDIIEQDLELDETHNGFTGLCPFHADSNPSFAVSEELQRYKCFACGASGDVFDWLQEYKKLNFKQAQQYIAKLTDNKPAKRTPKKRKIKTPKVKYLPPDKNNLPNWQLIYSLKIGKELKMPKPISAHYYPSQGFCVRYPCEKHGKTFRYLRLAEFENGNVRWVSTSFDLPYPIYKKVDESKTTVIVEGEKCVDIARKIYPQFNFITNPCGASAIKRTEWPKIDGNIVIWPDNDKPGEDFMEYMYEIYPTARIVYPRKEWAKKYDIADAIGAGSDIPTIIKQAVLYKNDEPTYGDLQTRASKLPFKVLGFDGTGRHGHIYIHQYEYMKILDFTPKEIVTKAAMLQIASKSQWMQSNWVDDALKLSSDNIETLADTIHTLAKEQGMFDASRAIGRGVHWLDNKPVIHLGDSIIIDGKTIDIREYQGKYIFEGKPQKIRINLDQKLHTSESAKYYGLMKKVTWRNNINARYVAGWVVCSLIGGALEWRPHLWLTGAAGSGKTEVLQKIIKPVLANNMCLDLNGESTSAGIRQTIGTDSVPVIFDEAESDTYTAERRVSELVAMIRAASADSEGRTVKGGAGHDPANFKIRCCFALASIMPNLNKRQDETRHTVCEIVPQREVGYYEREIKPVMNKLLTKEYCEAFQARAISLIPVIRKNAVVFAAALSRKVSDARLCKHYGTLLAGCYSLMSEEEINIDEAIAHVMKMKVDTITRQAKSREENYLLDHIKDVIIRVNTEDSKFEARLCELLKNAIDRKDVVAKQALATNHLHICKDSGMVRLPERSTVVRGWMKDTQWSTGWKILLSRVDGAETDGKYIYLPPKALLD